MIRRELGSIAGGPGGSPPAMSRETRHEAEHAELVRGSGPLRVALRARSPFAIISPLPQWGAGDGIAGRL